MNKKVQELEKNSNVKNSVLLINDEIKTVSYIITKQYAGSGSHV